MAAPGPGRCEATCQEVIVPQVRVHNFSVSLDGFGTGEGQALDAPFGHAGTRLHEWFFPTRTFRAMQGQPGGSLTHLRERLGGAGVEEVERGTAVHLD